MVGINVPIPVPMAFHSFGEWKASSGAGITGVTTAYALLRAGHDWTDPSERGAEQGRA